MTVLVSPIGRRDDRAAARSCDREARRGADRRRAAAAGAAARGSRARRRARHAHSRSRTLGRCIWRRSTRTTGSPLCASRGRRSSRRPSSCSSGRAFAATAAAPGCRAAGASARAAIGRVRVTECAGASGRRPRGRPVLARSTYGVVVDTVVPGGRASRSSRTRSMSHRLLQRRTRASASRVRPGVEEDLRLEALVVHPRGAVAGRGDRVLDQHRDLVERLRRDRPHHDVAPVLADARHRADLGEGQAGRQERGLGRGRGGRGRHGSVRAIPVECLYGHKGQQAAAAIATTASATAAFTQHVVLPTALRSPRPPRFEAPIFLGYSAAATEASLLRLIHRRRYRRE